MGMADHFKCKSIHAVSAANRYIRLFLSAISHDCFPCQIAAALPAMYRMVVFPSLTAIYSAADIIRGIAGPQITIIILYTIAP